MIVVIFDSITKEENRTVQKRGKNHEIKQYMEFMLSEIFYNSMLWLVKNYILYIFNLLFSKYLSIFSIHVVKIFCDPFQQ